MYSVFCMLCVVYVLWVCIVCDACVMYLVHSNGLVWLDVWEILGGWERGLSSCPWEAHGVHSQWTVSFLKTCLVFICPAFSITQREAAVVGKRGGIRSGTTRYLPLKAGAPQTHSRFLPHLLLHSLVHCVTSPPSRWLCVICPHLARSGDFVWFVSKYSSKTSTLLHTNHGHKGNLMANISCSRIRINEFQSV